MGKLSDLWKYDPASGNWTWVNGSSESYEAATYGTLGEAAVSNTPGARGWAASWVDLSGNFWFFGGATATGTSNANNDLWKFSPTTHMWTWMSGSNTSNAVANYGTACVEAAANVPGARMMSACCSDASGSLWLFGGQNSSLQSLNDLWKYDPLTGCWTWMTGSRTALAAGIYGPVGLFGPTYTPGARVYGIAGFDAAGKLCLFGGSGRAASTFGSLNDLWKYDPGSNNWAWMGGSSASNEPGTYGTIGAASATNMPGGRSGIRSLLPSGGSFLLFGGFGYGASGSGYLNDLWQINLNASAAEAPTVISGQTVGVRAVDITFSEAMKPAALAPGNYSLSGGGAGTLASGPASVTWISGNTYRLAWTSGDFGRGDITMAVSSSLQDVTGQSMGTPNTWGTYVPITVSRFVVE